MSSKQYKKMIETRNKDNMPTYFQIGKNTLERAEQLYIADPMNKGLVDNSRPGKKMSIPVNANILSKSDSSERLNLAGKKDYRVASKSPLKQLATRLMKEENAFRQKYSLSKNDVTASQTSLHTPVKNENLSKLMTDKDKEESTRLQGVIGSLKNKANKKCHFKLFRNIDHEKLL